MKPPRAAGYGRGTVVLDGVELELMTAEELLATFRRPDYKPPLLPAIALELHQLIQRPLCDLRQVQQLIERDPMVASRVLRVAGSPLYSPGGAPRTLADAVLRLGTGTINQIVLEVTVGATLFRARGYDEPMEQVRKHSVATAYLARAIAHAVGEARELAFLCGLLHDIGIVACLLIIGGPSRPGPRPRTFADVWPIVDGLHAEVGQLLARMWGLPPEVERALAGHHLGTSSQPLDRLVRVVFLADALATQLGLGLEAPVPPEDLTRVYARIGLDERLLPELQEYATKVVAQIT